MGEKDFDSIYLSAEDARLAGNDELALELYEEAYLIAPLTKALHMRALTHRRIGNDTLAISDFRLAIQEYDSDPQSRGAVKRDLASAYISTGDLDQAEELLHSSLEDLGKAKAPSERAATIGFMGRLSVARYLHGVEPNLDTALDHFTKADNIFISEDNRYMELYNKIPFSVTAAAAHERRLALSKSSEASELIPDFGNRSHKVGVFVARTLAISPFTPNKLEKKALSFVV